MKRQIAKMCRGVCFAVMLSPAVNVGFAAGKSAANAPSDIGRMPGTALERKAWLADWDCDPKHARLPRPKEWYVIRSDIGYEQVNLEDGSRVFRRKRPFGSWLPADCTTMAPSGGPSELRFSDPIPQAKPIRTESVAADFHAIDRDGFTIRLRVDVSDVRRNERLYAIPDGVQVYLRLAERKVKGKRQHPACTYDSGAGNYVNFPMSDGTMPVIEALFPAPAGRVGIPLGMLERPSGEHEVVVNLSHAHVSIVVDGMYVDEDLPFCAPGWPKGPAVAETYSPRVKSATFSCPAEKKAVPRLSADRPLLRPVQYWTPDGHNAWVGDVVTGWHDGRYHVFYLYDRRHHYSKAGKGGHFFAHLSTTDLAHWTEHPHALPIVHRWEAQGTGTPFVYQGQYCLAYGYHTERMPNNEGLPIGATYAVSDDGINFRRTEKIIGEGRNPAIFNRADGMLGLINSYLCTPGLYESDHPGDWKMIDADLPLNGDCPCLFDWNGRYYLLQGFTGFASSPNGKPGTFENWNKTGDDIYEGLSVPMVSPFSGNRRIMAGWLSGVRCEWGGWLVLRELVAYSDGRLGTKWVPECVPDVPVVGAAKGRTPIRESRAIYAFENLSPQEGFRIELMPEKSEAKKLSLTIDPVRGHAQFNVSEAEAELPYVKTMYEHMLDNPAEMKKKKPSCWGRKGRPDRGGDFAIGKIRGLDRPWGLRLAVWYDKKADATIVDVELAGQRTMITRHPGRFTELVSHEESTESPQLRKVVVNGAPFPLTVCEWTPPAKDFKITDYGAKRDGRPVTESIERAVDAAACAGGGRVIVPKGEWLTGAFKLKSDVALVLDKDAELHFPDDPVMVYRAPLGLDGRPQPTHRGLIEAEGCTNVAVMGEGTLKADVDYWHRNFRQNAQRGFPRPDFFFFSRCRNVRFEGFRVRGSPCWTMHFLLCEDILLRRVDSVCTGCNTDGLDLESCNRALVEGCSLDQDDDAYTIKSGLNDEGRRRNMPTQNVVIRNCRAVRAHALLGIGSEVSGGVRNIYMADCTVEDECLNWLFVKTNPKRGAYVENVTMERVRGRKAKEAVFRVLTQYDGNPKKELVNRDFTPLLTRISGVSVRDVVCLDAKDAIRIEGDARQPPMGLSAENICVGRLTRDLVRVSSAPDFVHKGIRVDLRAALGTLGLSE